MDSSTQVSLAFKSPRSLDSFYHNLEVLNAFTESDEVDLTPDGSLSLVQKAPQSVPWYQASSSKTETERELDDVCEEMALLSRSESIVRNIAALSLNTPKLSSRLESNLVALSDRFTMRLEGLRSSTPWLFRSREESFLNQEVDKYKTALTRVKELRKQYRSEGRLDLSKSPIFQENYRKFVALYQNIQANASVDRKKMHQLLALSYQISEVALVALAIEKEADSSMDKFWEGKQALYSGFRAFAAAINLCQCKVQENGCNISWEDWYSGNATLTNHFKSLRLPPVPENYLGRPRRSQAG